MPPVCSICIANYNGETMLADCIESVFAQTAGVPVEIIVHDDASTDGSIATLSRYPDVVTILSKENVGFCIANNRMVARATGEYVLLLNNDAALFPDALAVLLDAARAQQPAGFLTLPQYDWEMGKLVDLGCMLDFFYNPVPNFDPRRRDVAYVIGACLFAPRALWNELGGFPEWFESIGEDLHVCCLARLRGAPMQVTTLSGYRHRQGASFGGNRVDAGRLRTTFRRRRLSERNKTSVMVICTPTMLVWPMLAAHIAMLIAEGVLMTTIRWDRKMWTEIYGPAIRFACLSPVELRERRRQAQATRRISLQNYLRVFVVLPRKLGMLLRHGVPVVR